MCLFFVVSCYLFEQLPKSVSATLYFTELGCSNVAEDRRQGKEKWWGVHSILRKTNRFKVSCLTDKT